MMIDRVSSVPRLRSGRTAEVWALRAAIIAEARGWIGTPFRHQAAVKGVGCDCAGLVRGVGDAAGVLRIAPEDWRQVASYGRQPHPRRMKAALQRFLIRVPPSKARPGDVLWMHWREGLPMHLAIIGEHEGRLTIIHAFADFDKVVEHGLTQEWRDRVTSCWRFPGLVGLAGRTGPTPSPVCDLPCPPDRAAAPTPEGEG